MAEPTRGAIRTEISTSTDVLVAGTPFTLFVTVYNPFEVPITLHRISTYLPTEFVADEDEKPGLFGVISMSMSTVGTGGGRIVTARGTGTGTGDGRPRFGRGTGDGGGGTTRTPEAAAALAHAEAELQKLYTTVKPLSQAEEAALAQAKAKVAELSNRQPSTDETEAALAEAKAKVDELTKAYYRLTPEAVAAIPAAQAKVDELRTATYDATYPFTLQPGNSKTCIFTLQTRRKMWFTPSTYKLSFDVIYDIDGKTSKNSDTIAKTLQVRASLVAIAVGAAAGALVGWTIAQIEAGVTFTTRPDGIPRFVQNFFSLFGTLLLAMMSVIVIARTKDSQPVVSVEDIWGGVVVGFLVAYSGQNFIGNRQST